MTSSPLLPTRGDGQTGPIPFVGAPRHPRRLGPEPTVLVIGYPAPAAVDIVERLLATDARTIACVVSRDVWSEASRLHRDGRDAGRLRLFEGAAATPGLGLPHTAWRILDTTDEIYGVAPAQEIAAGHIQDFADECPRLRKLHLIPQDPADRAALPASPRRGLFRRIGSLVSGLARIRTAFSSLATALGSWDARLNVDVTLSSVDLERDLWPGVTRIA